MTWKGFCVLTGPATLGALVLILLDMSKATILIWYLGCAAGYATLLISAFFTQELEE